MALHHDESGVVGRLKVDSSPASDESDVFDLRRRFCATQRKDFDRALREINAGRKCGCWSWYIFVTHPYVVNGEERGSDTNQDYALRDLHPNRLRGDDAARAYLRFAADGVNLRANYVLIMTAVAEQLEQGVDPITLVGFLDNPKLRSSLRLFERVTRDGLDEEVNTVCCRALSALKEPCE
jgi:uncharacterized protein (DUF1810 family)